MFLSPKTIIIVHIFWLLEGGKKRKRKRDLSHSKKKRKKKKRERFKSFNMYTIEIEG